MPTFKKFTIDGLKRVYKERCPDGLWFSKENMEAWNTAIRGAWIEEPGQHVGDGGGSVPWIYFVSDDRAPGSMLPFFSPRKNGLKITEGRTYDGCVSLRFMDAQGSISVVAQSLRVTTDLLVLDKMAQLGLSGVDIRPPLPAY